MFDGAQLLDSKEDLPTSESIISKDKIKIKRRVRKVPPPATHLISMSIIVKPKQIRARQIVKPTSKAKGKITSLPDAEDPKVLIMQLT